MFQEKGISYFEGKYIEERQVYMAVKFYKEGNHIRSIALGLM